MRKSKSEKQRYLRRMQRGWACKWEKRRQYTFSSVSRHGTRGRDTAMEKNKKRKSWGISRAFLHSNYNSEARGRIKQGSTQKHHGVFQEIKGFSS